jgi:hypothetical protein
MELIEQGPAMPGFLLIWSEKAERNIGSFKPVTHVPLQPTAGI